MVSSSPDGVLKLVVITGDIIYEQQEQLDLYVLVKTPQQRG